jgi:tetratricopeptide (TPR) repeat protein
LPAAVSLAGQPRRQVRAALTSLTRANLLTEYVPGRYTMHDLLHSYAIEQGQIQDTGTARHEALHRVLDHYLHTADAAAQLLFPQRDPIDLSPAVSGVVPESLTSADAAPAWFTAEHAVLSAAIGRAAAAGLDIHAWQLAWVLRTFQFRQGHWHDQIATHRIAVAAARRLGDLTAQARMLQGLALPYVRLGRFADAEAHFRHAIDVWTELGDPTGQAVAHMGLAQVAEQRGHFDDLLNHAEQGLELFRAAGNRGWIGAALNAVGQGHTRLGDHRQALEYCQQALTLLQALGDRHGEATTWDTLGNVYRGLADYEQAVACYRHAVDLYRDLGDRYFEADSLSGLGDTRHAAGDPEAARTAWQQALDILEQLDHPDADKVRARLRP